ncbi:MAG: hypothetical protein KGJ59_07190 [Bacteroidota bacterium]|nr:hypothetical protein [Bacteroidota bacterium]
MAKQQDFAEKAKKASAERGVKCPKCGTVKVPTAFINSVKTEAGTYRFNRQLVQVCKCNEKSVYA